MNLIKLIDEERKRQGYTSRTKFCLDCGLNGEVLNTWIFGRTGPTLYSLERMANKLGMEIRMVAKDDGK